MFEAVESILVFDIIKVGKLPILPYVDRLRIEAGTQAIPAQFTLNLWIEVPLLVRPLQERLDHLDAIDHIIHFLVNQQLGLFR